MAIVVQPKFPVPNRTKQEVVHAKDEDGVIDIGWCEGVMSDGRPFRMEMWAQSGVSMLTAFFSSNGIEKADAPTIKQLIISEGLLSFGAGKEQFVDVNSCLDDGGSPIFAVQIVVGDDDQTYVSGSMPIFANTQQKSPTSIFNPEPIK